MNTLHSFWTALLLGLFFCTTAPSTRGASLDLELPVVFRLGPNSSFGLTASQLSMDISRIYNYSNVTSGPVSLELWAILPDNPTQGHKLGTYADGSVVAPGYIAASTNLKTTFTQPPNGVYNVAMYLMESGSYRDGYQFSYQIRFGNIYFQQGNAGWQTTPTGVAVSLPPVYNGSEGGQSGTLRAEWFVLTQPYTAGTLTPGPRIATYTYPQLLPARFNFNAYNTTLVFTQPADGTYTSVLVLAELSAGTWQYKDSVIFSTPVTFGGSAATVANPVITPNGGTVQGCANVSITTATGGANIRYTTNGTTPVETSTLYSTPFTVTSTATVKAKAFKTGMTPSSVVSASFTVNAATTPAPAISPPGGTSAGAVQVTLSTPAGFTIRYTLDGSTPSESSTLYGGSPITVSATTTLKARAFAECWTPGPVSTATFTITPPATVASPQFSESAGNKTTPFNLRLSSATAGAAIHYTLDGSSPAATPGGATQLFTADVPVSTTTTVRAQAFKAGLNASAQVSATYTFNTPIIAAPVLSPPAGTYYAGSLNASATSTTPDVEFYYTLDGTDPTTSSTRAFGGFLQALLSPVIVKVRAFKTGWTPSPVVSAYYQITPGDLSSPYASCAWEVREFIADGALNNLADANALTTTSGRPILVYQSDVINHHDPQNPADSGGFFNGDRPFACDNKTPHGLNGANNGDDDNFALFARCRIVITQADDYTFGFSSDDGARLRIENATFISSTRLNPNNPANPAHNGNTLSYPDGTGNSDTLGVCHLLPGSYNVDFLTWEGGGGAYCEVFAARGAKTSLDSSFRLIGHVAEGVAGNNCRITAPGWQVSVLPQAASSLQDAMQRFYIQWADREPARKFRLFTANDSAERDPVTVVIEGTDGDMAAGPWFPLYSGPTNLPATRNAAGPLIGFDSYTGYHSYRLTFPALRNAAAANSMQVSEVQLMDAANNVLTVPGDAVLATTPNSPAGETAAEAIDGTTNTKYLNFDKLNSGLTISPGTRAYPVINFADPQAGGGRTGSQVPYPNNTAGDDNNFALSARATLLITTPGEYTFCLLGDDGSRLRIKGSRGWTVSSPAPNVLLKALPDGMQYTTCCADVFGTVSLAAGSYPVELIFNEITGGANLALWSARGRHTSFSPQEFSLLGVNGGTLTTDTVPFSLEQRGFFNNDASSVPHPVTGIPVSTSGCNYGGSLETGEPAPFALTNSSWWIWSSPISGPVRIDTIGSDFDTVLAVYSGGSFAAGTVTGLVSEAANDDIASDDTSGVIFQAVAGTVYRIQIGSWGNSGTGHIRLNISASTVPGNDAFANPVSLGNSTSIAVSGTTSGATREAGEPYHTNFFPPATVWYSWTSPYSGEFIFDTAGSPEGTSVAVYDSGGTLNSLKLLGSGTSTRVMVRAVMSCRMAVTSNSLFTSSTFALSILAVPQVTAYGITGNSPRRFAMDWRSEPLTTYRIEQTTDFSAWSTIAGCVPSTGNNVTMEFGPFDAGPRRFFRVRRE